MNLYIRLRSLVVFWFCGVVEKQLWLCRGRCDDLGAEAVHRLVAATSTDDAERDDIVERRWMEKIWPLLRACPHKWLWRGVHQVGLMTDGDG